MPRECFTKGIQAESGTEINIEDDGTVHIYAPKAEDLERAKAMIERMFQEIEVGKVYTGKIVSITAFGAFMEVLPGKDGLIHVSELAEGRTENVEDVVKKGQVITAKCLGVDEKGRVKKHEQQCYKDAVFALLHSPPRDHGVNCTSWRMDDIIRVLRKQGVFACKDIVRRIIKDAGFRLRLAKKVLTSTDPEYKQRLAEITRILSSLTEDERFFSIDEYGHKAFGLSLSFPCHGLEKIRAKQRGTKMLG